MLCLKLQDRSICGIEWIQGLFYILTFLWGRTLCPVVDSKQQTDRFMCFAGSRPKHLAFVSWSSVTEPQFSAGAGGLQLLETLYTRMLILHFNPESKSWSRKLGWGSSFPGKRGSQEQARLCSRAAGVSLLAAGCWRGQGFAHTTGLCQMPELRLDGAKAVTFRRV